MNAILEFAVVWLLWTSLWWAVLAASVALWFRLKPPQTAAVRHAALAAAIVAGTLAGLIPRWGDGVVSLPQTVVSRDVAFPPIAIEPAPHDVAPVPPAPVQAIEPIEPSAPTPSVETQSLAPITKLRDWRGTGKNALILAWGLGAIFLSVRLARAVRMTLRWRREASPLPDVEQAEFVAIKRELDIRRAAEAGAHREVVTPLVLCGWPPMVLAPSDWSTWEPDSRGAAWRHELDHVRRFDDWWRMLSEGLRVLFWFHPGVHWLLSRREQEAELLSDEAAVIAGCPPQELAQVLIDACRRPHSPVWTVPAGTFFSPKSMKVRIARLLEAPSAEALCRPAPRGLVFAALAGMSVLALAGSMRWITANAVPPEEKMDLAKLERRIAKEPTYRGTPKYCLLAFGKKMEPRWLVLDIVAEPWEKDGENVAYFDRDGDGDLTKPGNRIVSTSSTKSSTEVSFSPEPLIHYEPQFDLGEVRLADGTKHTKFKLEIGNYVQDYRAVKFRLLLRGEHDQLVAYAPGASLLRFGDTSATAPVVHLDGPLTFRNYKSDGRLSIPTSNPFARDTPESRKWYDEHPPTYGVEKLHPGRMFRIEAELGTYGVGRGTFAKLFCGAPPDGVHPQAELTLPGGKTLSVALTQRYATTMFGGEVVIPKETPPGKATIKLSFPDWGEGKVEPASDDIEVAAAKDAPVVSRLEPDRKARIGELLGVQIAAYPVAPRGGEPTTIDKDGMIRLPDLMPIAVAGKTAEEIEQLILAALGKRREPDTHVAVCFLRAAADVPDPPKEVAAPAKPKSNHITVVGQLIDDETGQPIEKAGWEWGMFDPNKPEQIAWGHSRQAGGDYPDGKFTMPVNIGANGNHHPLRVFSAGYETTIVVHELAKPYPEKIERVVRLKRGRNITGVLRDHEGKPVANGWVFFIPKGHSSNIVEGLTGVDAYKLPSESRDDAVSEVRTNNNGTFSLPTGADGTIAASTDLVDLWPFALPEDGHADIKMPAPAYLVIDLSYWYLDDFAKKGKRAYSPDSEDPNQCWIRVDHRGSTDPQWKAIEYRRQMFVFAKDARAKLSKGVKIDHVFEGQYDRPIPKIGHNKNLTTKIRVPLPPGSYRLQRLRAGPFAPVEERQIELKPGEETRVSYDRGDGSSVLGKATWPADMKFVRQPGEESRKLDWTVPESATVLIAPIDADGKEGQPIEAAKIQADGSFFVATNLDPGKYKATALVYLPESDDARRTDRWRGPDCTCSQEFTVPEPARGPFGSPPVEVEIKMEVGKGGRFVGAETPPADDPPKAEAPGEKEKEPFTAWGEAVGGLQAGLGFKAGEKREYHHGETITLAVRVRNVSKEAVKFKYIKQYLDENPPIVTGADGKRVLQHGYLVEGLMHVPVEVNLEPGKEIVLESRIYGSSGQPYELRPVDDTRPLHVGIGKVGIQYEQVFGSSSIGRLELDPVLSKLATGKLELVVHEAPAEIKEAPEADPPKAEAPGGDKPDPSKGFAELTLLTHDGAPAANVRVRLMGHGGMAIANQFVPDVSLDGVTDVAGKARFGPVKPGMYTLSHLPKPLPSHHLSGNTNTLGSVTIEAGKTAALEAKLLPPGTAKVSGKVTLPEGLEFRRNYYGRITVEPLAWKHVVATHVSVQAVASRFMASAKADAEGNFVFEELLPPGEYTMSGVVAINSDDPAPRLLVYDLGMYRQTPFKVAADTKEVTVPDLVPDPAGLCQRLRVIDPAKRVPELVGTLTHDGKPVPDAKVELYRNDHHHREAGDRDQPGAVVKTDAEGRFRFLNFGGTPSGNPMVESTTAVLRINHPTLVLGSGRSTIPVTVPTKLGTEHRVDLPLVPGGFVDGTNTFRGVSPVWLRYKTLAFTAGGIVEFIAHTHTDYDGKFRIGPLPPSVYVVEAGFPNRPGPRPLGEVTVEAGKTATFVAKGPSPEDEAPAEKKEAPAADPPKAEAPAERGKEPFTAWGEAIGGLQAGLGFKAGEKRAYAHGETVTLVVRVRNVGKEAVKFDYIPEVFIENPPGVWDEQGKPVSLAGGLVDTGVHIGREANLTPGKEIWLSETTLEFASRSEAVAPFPKSLTIYGAGKFQVRFDKVLGTGFIKPDPVLSKLATGKLELVVHEAPAEKKEASADAPKDDPPKAEKSKDADERYIKVTGQVVDDATGQPIETCLWELGARDPKNFANTLWGFSRGSSTDRDGKFSRSVWVDKNGVHTRMRVKVAGYEPAVVVGELPEPLPKTIERIIRMKRTGESVSGVVRDHQGKPAAGAKVFFIPEGHSSNIVDGIAGADQTMLPLQPYQQSSRDGNVAETVADVEGRFSMPIAGAGTLAVSTYQVDLWPFPMPAAGKPAELTMPAPAKLVIELDEWRLDGVYKKPKDERKYASEGDPRECWLLLQGGPGNPTGDEAIDAKLRRAWRYERPMFVLSPTDDPRISKHVRVVDRKETPKAETIAGFGANTRLQAKIEILLPPGNYSISRAKIGARGTEVVNISLKPGEVHLMDRWKRAEGAAVRGTVKLPANMQFVRQPGEAPKNLDWSVVRWAYVWIRSENLDRQEYANVDAEGRFAVPTHLPPGKYKIEAYAVLPDRDRGRTERTGLTELAQPDLKHDTQILTIPEPPPGPAGSPPLEFVLTMKPVGDRIVAADPPKAEAPVDKAKGAALPRPDDKLAAAVAAPPTSVSNDRKLVATWAETSIYADQLQSPTDSTIEFSAARLLDIVTKHATDDYRSREKLELKPEWTESLSKSVWRKVRAATKEESQGLTEEEQYMISYAWSYAGLKDWHLTKSLYERYGGRVGMGSLGLWLAADGRNALIREAEKAGTFKIHDPQIEKAFWAEANKPNFADAYPTGERLKSLLDKPPHLWNESSDK